MESHEPQSCLAVFAYRGLLEWTGAMLDIRHSLAYKETEPGRRFLGRAFVCMRRWTDAVREYKKAILLAPEDGKARAALTEVRSRRGSAQPSDASD
jgi:hypothetical protein